MAVVSFAALFDDIMTWKITPVKMGFIYRLHTPKNRPHQTPLLFPLNKPHAFVKLFNLEIFGTFPIRLIDLIEIDPFFYP